MSRGKKVTKAWVKIADNVAPCGWFTVEKVPQSIVGYSLGGVVNAKNRFGWSWRQRIMLSLLIQH